MVFIGVDLDQIDKMAPRRVKSAPGPIELNQHFGAKTDLLDLECTDTFYAPLSVRNNRVWLYHTFRPLIANLHTLFKATGPKRQPVQGRALNSDIIYPVKDSRPRNPHPVRTPLGQISPGNDDNMDKYKALSSRLQSLPPPFHPLLGTFALGPSPLGTFVTWSVIDWSILRSKNKKWKLIATFNFEFSSKFTSW